MKRIILVTLLDHYIIHNYTILVYRRGTNIAVYIEYLICIYNRIYSHNFVLLAVITHV